MAGGTQKYSVVESGNVGLGQVGSTYADGTSITSITSGVVVAITMLADTTFTLLTPENADYLTVPGKGYESLGDTTATSDTFPKGITIYGRWTTVDVNSGNIIAYFAG